MQAHFNFYRTIMRRFISSICIMMLVYIGYGCNNDDDFSPNCYQEDNRAVIERITRVTATILGPQNQDCSTDFVIEPNENINNTPLKLKTFRLRLVGLSMSHLRPKIFAQTFLKSQKYESPNKLASYSDCRNTTATSLSAATTFWTCLRSKASSSR